MKLRQGILLAFTLSSALFSERTLAADFSQDAYTAPASPADLLWVERAAALPAGYAGAAPFARLTLGFADDPLVLKSDQGEEQTLIDSELSAHLSLGLVLAQRLQLALLAPAYLRNGASGGGYQLDGVVAGDPGLDLRLTLLDRSAPLELAVAGTLRVPLGANDAFASNGSASAWLRALASKSIGQRTWLSLSVGPTLRPATTQQALDVSDALRILAGVYYGLDDHWGLTGELAGSTPFSSPLSSGRSPLEAALGLRFQNGPWVLAAGGGPGLSNGFGTPDFRALATLGAQLGKVDAPPPVAQDDDPDKDGIVAGADHCPSAAEDRDGWKDDDGCPEDDDDRDGDSVLDAHDRCLEQAEDVDGFQDDDGCPDPDNDQDGVADRDDKCPGEAEDRDGWQDSDGCPDPDNDQDGILDRDDKCPNEAETINGKDDSDGCPDLIRVEAGQIRTLEPIFFEYRSAKIQTRSQPLLAELANLLKSRPDLGRISIDGHTDAQGADNYNLKLSQERAQSVMTFLVDAGVEQARLEAHGFGESKPIADNRTADGRARNRRVEFQLVDMLGSQPREHE